MKASRKVNLHVDTVKKFSDNIFSPSEITPELGTSSIKPDPKLKILYNYLDQSFHKDGVSYNHQLILRKVTYKFSSKIAWNIKKTYKLFIEITNILHMNMFELACWSLLLDHNTSSLFRPVLSTYFTAFQAKTYTNNDMSLYENQLNYIIPNFKYLYYNWQLVCDIAPEITLKEIYLRFSDLIQKTSIEKNYEKIIDELIDVPKKKSPIKLVGIEMDNKVLEEMEHLQYEFFQEDILSPIEKL